MNLRTFRSSVISAALACAGMLPVSAEPVSVVHAQGVTHGFVAIRLESGTLIGHGEYVQYTQGDRITARFILSFRDGSLDDETSVFTQNKTFQFVSDHHIQRGPFFKHPSDQLLDASGNVTIRSTGKDGKEQVETNHIDLPPDVSNGMLSIMLQNVPHNAPPFSVGMVLPSGKGRLVKLDIAPEGSQPFTAVTGDRRTATIFRVHIALGGVAGVVAPMIGKQPSDIDLWVLEGEVPLFVREVGQLSEGGPIVSIELAGTSFAHAK